MTKLGIWITELSWKFYACRMDNEKLDHESVVSLFGGWNPQLRSEHEISLYIRDNADLFEDYEIEYVYFDNE